MAGLAARIEVNNLNAEFARTLSLLRQEKGVSQRAAAAELGISQALMSHYENGIREPGLSFVVKACDYVRRLPVGPHPDPGWNHHWS